MHDTGSGCGEEESGKPSVVSKQPRRSRRLGWPPAGGHTHRRGADRRLELRALPAVEASTAAQTPTLSRLLVSPFTFDGGAAHSADIAQGLTQEVVRQLASFREIEVVAGPQPTSSGMADPVQYELQGALRVIDGRYRLSVRLIDIADGSVVWAENYDAEVDPARLLDSESAIAAKVATAVAQPYGVVFRTDAAKLERETPNDWAAYQCTLAYYAYRADLNPQAHSAVERCLEKTTVAFPTYSTAWALLSLTYLDEVRFRYAVGGGSTPPLERAFDAARRAVDLDPNNARALQSYMTALFFSQDVEAAMKVGARAIAINPNDTELLAEYGLRLALTGEWARGRDLMLNVLDRNPGPLGYYRERGRALLLHARRLWQRRGVDRQGEAFRQPDLPRDRGRHLWPARSPGGSGGRTAMVRQGRARNSDRAAQGNSDAQHQA